VAVAWVRAVGTESSRAVVRAMAEARAAGRAVAVVVAVARWWRLCLQSRWQLWWW
jgi:hypothetical protein